MTAAITHIGELVANDINQRFRNEPTPSVCSIPAHLGRACSNPAHLDRVKQLNRGDIKRVTLIFPGGSEMRVPVETRAIVEY
jgi:ABC-type sulfate transport system substrate-binding protein